MPGCGSCVPGTGEITGLGPWQKWPEENDDEQGIRVVWGPADLELAIIVRCAPVIAMWVITSTWRSSVRQPSRLVRVGKRGGCRLHR